MARVVLREDLGAEGLYFPPPGKIERIRSGCTVLDCTLGGGWPIGRIVNVVGDKAVGKTLLAIEAAVNFAHQYPKGRIWYRESEAAFDEEYANDLGLPLDRVDFGPDGPETLWNTVEDIFEDLDTCIEEATKAEQPGLYIVDSLDALSSRAEMGRGIAEAGYRLEKQKVLGELFRRLSRRVKAARICVMIISQVRDRIGVVFGEKHTRTGGKSLDFYASQILWLSNLGVERVKRDGIKRATAVGVRARCKKNKVGTPFRECEFRILFGFGIDNEEANRAFLQELKKPASRNIKGKELDALVREAWALLEAEFAPVRKKYTNG